MTFCLPRLSFRWRAGAALKTLGRRSVLRKTHHSDVVCWDSPAACFSAPSVAEQKINIYLLERNRESQITVLTLKAWLAKTATAMETLQSQKHKAKETTNFIIKLAANRETMQHTTDANRKRLIGQAVKQRYSKPAEGALCRTFQ